MTRRERLNEKIENLKHQKKVNGWLAVFGAVLMCTGIFAMFGFGFCAITAYLYFTENNKLEKYQEELEEMDDQP